MLAHGLVETKVRSTTIHNSHQFPESDRLNRENRAIDDCSFNTMIKITGN
jgi:hypothetical protein